MNGKRLQSVGAWMMVVGLVVLGVLLMLRAL
jgi:hypothetical protein